MVTSLVCNKFGGIRQKSAVFSQELITASDCQNVELYDTGINSGTGIRIMNGNRNISSDLIPDGERIINEFETIQGGTKYFLVHTVSDTEGKIYLFDKSARTLTEKITELAVTNTSSGIDYAQGVSDLFIFANGTDFLQYINIIEKTSGEINATDSLGRDIKGCLGLGVFQGRVWTKIKNRMHCCVKGDVFDWATSEAGVNTSAWFNEFSKDVTAFHLYLSSLAVFFNDSSLLISDDYPFTIGEESPGGCAGYDALVFHGTDLYFYDDTKKGVFSFQQIVLGNKTLGQNIAIEIKNDLKKIDSTRLDEIRTLSVNTAGKNEIWLYFPDNKQNSTIYIYDYLNREWLKRVCQKINCFNIIDNVLYSGSDDGKILEEYRTLLFDGGYIPHYYYCTPMNLGSDNTMKILYLPPRISFGLPTVNNFLVKYIKDFDVFKPSKIKQISASSTKNLPLWGTSRWGQAVWLPKNMSFNGKFPNATFKVLEIHIYTEEAGQGFAIKNMEFSKIKVKQV